MHPRSTSAPEQTSNSLRALDLRRAPLRLLLAFVAGLVAFALTYALGSRPGSAVVDHMAWYLRAVLAWDAGAVTMIGLTWSIILRADPAETEQRAAANDPGRWVVWFIAVAASLFSLFAATVVLKQARVATHHGTAWSALTLLGIALSWLLTHTAYTMRYAHLYYRRGGHSHGRRGGPAASHHARSGGLRFPEDDPQPCDLDFAYFAFTLGMCFQTSDVLITHWRIRREVLLHALISFVYNTTILALALNLASGLLG